MKLKSVKPILILISVFFAFSCELFDRPANVLAPQKLREAVIKYAHKYLEIEAKYLWGRQDPLPRTTYVDCSGFVIRCYQYACEECGYELLFSDTTANGMQKYSERVDQPELGDLIFMGNNEEVTHIALFEREEDGIIYFIDSSNLTGGVSERSNPKDSTKFIGFKRMYLKDPSLYWF